MYQSKGSLNVLVMVAVILSEMQIYKSDKLLVQ